jgi:hypothetical protein
VDLAEADYRGVAGVPAGLDRVFCAPRSCKGDKGRPLEAGLQEQASNHPKLRWLRAIVVSVLEKLRQKTVAGGVQRDERKRTIDQASKRLR